MSKETIVDALADLPFELQAQIAENLFRKDLTPSEIEAMRRRCEAFFKAKAKERQGRPGIARSGKLPEHAGMSRARDQLAAFAGMSGRTIDKISAVVTAADAEPGKFAHLVEQMDRTRNVDAAYCTLRQTRQRAEYHARADRGGTVKDLNAMALAGMRFAVIYADPPWEFKVYSGKGKQRSAERHYDTSSLEAIKDLPIERLAAKDCSLLLWCVMPELPGAFAVIKAWGFEYKTTGLVWVKQNRNGEGLFTGMGYWTRANSENACSLHVGRPSAWPRMSTKSSWRPSASTAKSRRRLTSGLNDCSSARTSNYLAESPSMAGPYGETRSSLEVPGAAVARQKREPRVATAL